MQRFIACTFLILLLSSVYCAEEHTPAQRAQLGISIDQSDTNFDDRQGIAIQRITEHSNAARIGLLVGDRILSVNDTAIDSPEKLGELLSDLKVGNTLRIKIMREGNISTCSGTLNGPPNPARLKQREQSLEERVAALRQQQTAGQRYTLQELLIILRQIEHDLPAAAREFKEVYPNGRFHISINIDIDSDTTQSSDAETAQDNTAADSDQSEPTTNKEEE